MPCHGIAKAPRQSHRRPNTMWRHSTWQIDPTWGARTQRQLNAVRLRAPTVAPTACASSPRPSAATAARGSLRLMPAPVVNEYWIDSTTRVLGAHARDPPSLTTSCFLSTGSAPQRCDHGRNSDTLTHTYCNASQFWQTVCTSTRFTHSPRAETRSAGARLLQQPCSAPTTTRCLCDASPLRWCVCAHPGSQAL